MKKLQTEFAVVQSLTDLFIIAVHTCLFNEACDSLRDMHEQEKKHPKHVLANVILCREWGGGQLEVNMVPKKTRTTKENQREACTENTSPPEWGKLRAECCPLESPSHPRFPCNSIYLPFSTEILQMPVFPVPNSCK